VDNRQDVFQDDNDDGDRQTDISLSMKGSSVVRGRKRSHVYKRDERGPCTVGGIYFPPPPEPFPCPPISMLNRRVRTTAALTRTESTLKLGV